jgi:hypothetical protein
MKQKLLAYVVSISTYIGIKNTCLYKYKPHKINMSKITFNNKQSPFFKSLKEKVDNYFLTQQLHTSGNSKLLFKSLIQVFSALALYIILVFFTPGLFISIVLCALLGDEPGTYRF